MVEWVGATWVMVGCHGWVGWGVVGYEIQECCAQKCSSGGGVDHGGVWV